MTDSKTESNGWINRIYEKFTAPEMIRKCGYLAMVLFFGLFISAVLVALPPGPGPTDWYNIVDNWISDMGNHNYTPAPFLLDSALICTGILLIPFHFYLDKHIAPIPRSPEEMPAPHRWSYRFSGMAFFLNMIGSISMVFVGIFSEDRDYGLHFPFSIALFGSFALGAICLGFALTISDRKVVPSPWNYIVGAYGIHGLMLVGGFAGYHVMMDTSWAVLMEWIIFFALVAWLVPLFIFSLRHSESLRKIAEAK